VVGGRFLTVIALGGLALTGIASAAAPTAQWRPLLHAAGLVDVVGPRSDGQLVVSAKDRLFLLRPGGALEPFAAGAGGYVAGQGGEPYAALAVDRRLPGRHCSFHRDDVFVLDASGTPGVIRVLANGRALRLADLPKGAFPSGIAFDQIGRFGYRLLVTAVIKDKTTVYAFDCLGKPKIVVRDAALVEGGIVVAPRSFGRYGGYLIAADEKSGKIFAFGPGGAVRLVAKPTLPVGADIGVESLGFVPAGFGPTDAAYVADLTAPGSPTVGTESVLVLRGPDLEAAALKPGELVALMEGGGTTVAVRCMQRCTVRRVASAPAATHGEGHISFATAP
jgi:hypothetical protein